MKDLLDLPIPTKVTRKPRHHRMAAQSRRFNRILVCDFNAELCLVHVIKPHAYPFGDEYVALDPAELMRETEYAEQKQMRSMAARAMTRYSVRVIHGSPALKICNAAKEDVDLIVISTHGRTGYPDRQCGGTRCALCALPGTGDSVSPESKSSQLP